MRHRLYDDDGKLRCVTCRRPQLDDEPHWQWSDILIGSDAVGEECPECNTRHLETTEHEENETMTTYRIGNVDWISELARAVRIAKDGDVIVCGSEAKAELGKRAAVRICPDKTIRFEVEPETAE